jgi:dienelactone hydrolase
MRRLVLIAAIAVAISSAACGGTPSAVRTTAPPNAMAPGVSWSAVPAPAGHTLLMGSERTRSSEHPIGILIVTGTEGLNTDYPRFGQELAARGFDVAFGCWFASPPPPTPTDPEIGCTHAPQFVGVSEAAVPDLDALVAGARSVLSRSDVIALVGFSRGGGVALLRATKGATNPVVSIAGMVEGSTAWGELPSEVNIVPLAGSIHAPVLILHGEDDQLVPVSQARDLEAALRAHHDDVVAKYYPGQGHGLAQSPFRNDLIDQIAAFLCSRSPCTR